MHSKDIFVYGGGERSESVQVSAGPLKMIFEPENGFLRYVRLGDHELIRSIYAVVRDQNWNTIPWRIEELKVDSGSDRFLITFNVKCEEGPVRFVWRGEIAGTAGGRVTFRFDGEAQSDFLRNRIGICVLHSIAECAGNPCKLEHTNGSVESAQFPRTIMPNQPFMDVRAITHPVAAGVECEVRFEGDVFETEDQRNFGDMSFKTYSTPQDLPKPRQVRSGDRIQQCVTVTLLNPLKKTVLPVSHGRPPQLSISTAPIMPRVPLGLQLSKDEHRVTPIEVSRLRALRLGHLRAEVLLNSGDWLAQLRRASEQAQILELPLHLALHLGEEVDAELARFVSEAQAISLNVKLWIVYRRGEPFPTQQTISLARQRLSALNSALIAAAASPFYAEFNRNRPTSDSGALPCVPVTPQIHLTDRNTMIENIAAATELIGTAAAITPQQLVFSPITMKRAEPKASKLNVDCGEPPPTVDPRQSSLFGAAWTLAHLAQISSSTHLHSATYFETTGWRGVMETAVGSPLPEKFCSIPGAVFPLYHVFADVAGFDRVCSTHSSLPLEVAGLTLLDANGRRRILVANLQPHTQHVKIKTGTCEGQMRRLNGTNVEHAMREPEAFRAQHGDTVRAVGGKIELELQPHELVRIDIS